MHLPVCAVAGQPYRFAGPHITTYLNNPAIHKPNNWPGEPYRVSQSCLLQANPIPNPGTPEHLPARSVAGQPYRFCRSTFNHLPYNPIIHKSNKWPGEPYRVSQSSLLRVNPIPKPRTLVHLPVRSVAGETSSLSWSSYPPVSDDRCSDFVLILEFIPPGQR